MKTHTQPSTKDGQHLEAKNPQLESAIHLAVKRVTPVWPLSDIIAANPLKGFENASFRSADEVAQKYFHGSALPPTEFFQTQYQHHRILPADLEAAALSLKLPFTVSEVTHWLTQKKGNSSTSSEQFKTLSEQIDQIASAHLQQWQESEISKWVSAYLDEGQATWTYAGKHPRFFVFWRDLIRYDRSAKNAGITTFRSFLNEIPSDSLKTIYFCLEKLQIPEDVANDYLTRHLLSTPGWSGIMAYRSEELQFLNAAEAHSEIVDLLAVKLIYDCASVQWFCSHVLNIPARWQSIQQYVKRHASETTTSSSDRLLSLTCLEALEYHYRQKLFKNLKSALSRKPVTTSQRPLAQAVFCIDVRSEGIRRHLESTGRVETFGYAGFFGIPLAVQTQDTVKAQCPVLIRPKYLAEEIALPSSIQSSFDTAKVWLKKMSSHWSSAFALVESLGGIRAWSMIEESLLHSGHSRTRKTKIHYQKSEQGKTTLPYQLGISLEEQLQIAEAMLNLVGFPEHFGHFVLLCGHGSHTRNNSTAAALDCGACAGHKGSPNARIAAAIFNDTTVRARLKEKGFAIPNDTWFIACEHNTTTDEIVILDEALIPKSHQSTLLELKQKLSTARHLGSDERVKRLQKDPVRDATREATLRSVDWSEVRPEWGLTGNACFIVAPRWLTREVNLESRSFLHSYDWTKDPNGNLLETIMTAPMVVTQWINSQYYFSSVDNATFGSGQKTLHNVVGGNGLLEGSGGSLRAGLPLQSIHDGKTLVHEPMRLLVVIAAPRERILNILKRHPSVQNLVVNEWIKLSALEPEDNKIYLLNAELKWIES